MYFGLHVLTTQMLGGLIVLPVGHVPPLQRFTKGGDKAWAARFSFQQPAADRLILDGTMDGHTVYMQLQLFDRSTFQLVSRGFHWIQESPFNR